MAKFSLTNTIIEKYFISTAGEKITIYQAWAARQVT